MFKRNSGELNHVVVLRQFVQHLCHLRIALHNVREAIERRVVENIANYVRVDDSAVAVVHEGPCVYAYQRLHCRAKVVRRQVGAVCKLDVDQRVHRDSRVRSDLDKGVQGKSQPVVQFVCQILEQTRVIDCYVQREVRRVDEVGVLSNSRDDLGA